MDREEVIQREVCSASAANNCYENGARSMK